MVEYLKDLQTRNVHTRLELALDGVFFLGDRVFQVLRKLRQDGKVRGMYFTHYYGPPWIEPHAKVGIRYHNLADLESASSVLDTLCDEQKDIVIDKGRFEPTTGEFEHLPSEIVVDYIICHSFEFFLRVKEELGNELPLPNRIVDFLVRHREEITNQVINAKDIFRAETQVRPLTAAETVWVWERVVHHLLNAHKARYDYEGTVKRMLRERGINIA